MARKVNASTDKAPPSNEGGASDLAVLHPERNVTVGGRALVVREYGFIEGLQLRTLYAPLVDGLFERTHTGARTEYEDIADLLAAHVDQVVELVAVASDTTPAFIRTLNATDGALLLLVWWGANGNFFVQAVIRRLEMARLSAGRKSTPSSSDTASEIPQGSADTPSVS